VAGFIGGLDGEQLQHLAEVRVHPGEQPGRDDQGGLLVLDQVGHDLHHRRFDVGRQRLVDRPVDRDGRIPLRGRRVRVQPGRQVGPEHVTVGEVELAHIGAAGLDERAAGSQSPVRRRVADQVDGSGAAGPLGTDPPLQVRPATPDDIPAVGVVGEGVTPLAALGPKVHSQRRVGADDAQPVAGGQWCERPAHDQVRAVGEAERFQVEQELLHGRYAGIVTLPAGS
jgi:hypothetical protein